MRAKIISIVGTRPEYIKIAAIERELSNYFDHFIVDTGQHYDPKMSSIFLKELKITKPLINLKIGSGSPGKQTARMVEACENILISQQPNLVLVYGDTNSTLAGALSAVKLQIKLAHIEAGARSYDRSMPEEINRIICDHIASLLFCSSKYAVNCLEQEGISDNVHLVGDINYDIFLKSKTDLRILKKLNLKNGNYYLLTIHRQENTDDKKRLKKILQIMQKLDKVVVFPVHPRTKRVLNKLILKRENIIEIPPQKFSSFLALMNSAKAVLTDSGGIQKEAYWSSTPCITLRSSTEWPETVETGWNHLTDLNSRKIVDLTKNLKTPKQHPQLYGDGTTSVKISRLLKTYLDS